MAIRLTEIIDRISITAPLDVPQLMQGQEHLWARIKEWKAAPQQVQGGWHWKAAGAA